MIILVEIGLRTTAAFSLTLLLRLRGSRRPNVDRSFDGEYLRKIWRRGLRQKVDSWNQELLEGLLPRMREGKPEEID